MMRSVLSITDKSRNKTSLVYQLQTSVTIGNCGLWVQWGHGEVKQNGQKLLTAAKNVPTHTHTHTHTSLKPSASAASRINRQICICWNSALTNLAS